MINRTVEVVINLQGTELDNAIRTSLKQASDAIIQAYSSEHLDLRTITTKTNVTIAFAKFVNLGTLKSNVQLGNTYVINAFAMSQSAQQAGRASFETFMVILDDPDLYYSKTYISAIRRGLGIFLVSLHCSGAITLPMSFKWPGNKQYEKSVAIFEKICDRSEVLSFVRSIETTGGSEQDPAFSSLRGNQKRIEWFGTYATKVVLACGWHNPESIALEQLSEVYLSQSTGEAKLMGVSVFPTLIEVLCQKFGSRLEPEFHNPENWQRRISVIRSARKLNNIAAKQYSLSEDSKVVDRHHPKPKVPVVGMLHAEFDLSADEHFSKLAKCSPGIAHTDRVRFELGKARGDFDFAGKLNYWLEIQEAYLSQPREALKGVRTALGNLNLYLFHYLPYWYMKCFTTVPFPSTPDQLIGSVFVSRLLTPEEALPKTLMDFMNERARVFKWEPNSYYGTLKQIEVFFDFIISNNHRLRNASRFVQPLAHSDYPRTTNPLGTNKSPIPRRFLGLFIAYLEAYRTYVQYVSDQCIEGNITDLQVEKLTKFPKHVDTKANAENIGYMPLIFVNGRTVPLLWLPGFPKTGWMRLKNGRIALLPHPHGINQITVAVYTGLRHNHIQWLDADKFDSHAGRLDGEYTKLFVNTDKVKKKPWLPEVNVQVIRILRDQLRWRNSIDERGFAIRHAYNNNERTAYPKFLPLFAYGISGLPHHDDIYANQWRESIVGFQWVLRNNSDVLGNAVPELYRLLPPGIDFNENDVQKKYLEFGDVNAEKVELRVATEITPHSARVAVVSELIRFLPAELIGQRITGQTEGTVYHYVVPDSDEIKRDQVHQAMHLRDLARKQHINQVCSPSRSEHQIPYLKADQINSNLAQSMKVSMAETFARYGCISLSIGDMPTGIEVLEDNGLGNAAFNKTEICPYGNHCPPSLIKELRGIRRCGVCPYAVRSIDHLPAICARQKQDAERIAGLDQLITQGNANKSRTPEELDAMEDERQRLGEELAGWELCIEVLEQTRQRISAGVDERRWVVEQPEILAKNLRRVVASNTDADYLLSRLAECTSYPGFQSVEISRQFDILRRRILRKSGASLDEVLSLNQPVDSAAECAGLIRSLVAVHKLTLDDINALLTTDVHLNQIAFTSVQRITNG